MCKTSIMTGRKLFPADTPVFGAWTSLGHPSITEIFTRAGVDFVGIDLEHSTVSHEQSQRIIAAAQAGGTACLPRVASHNGEQIRRLLDSGADGVIVPNVSTPHEVEQIINWSKYPPLGKRSYGVARAQGYGFDFEAYVRAWNDRSTILIQIESIQAVDAVDALLAHEAVDGAMIGPYDISGSLGIPGQLAHPRVTQACARVLEACQRAGKACGTQLVEPTPETASEAFSAGYAFVVLASDVFLLWKWTERMRQLITAHRRPRPHELRGAHATAG
jgi:2-dehydro-3-deoxyglucarate aldolase